MRIEKKYGKVLMNAVLLCILPLVPAFAGLLPENRQATATAEQEMKQSVKDILATITQSRSTNTRGYKVVIRDDGSATAETGGASLALPAEPSPSQQFPPGSIDTKTLRRLLTEIGDVSRIPTGGCAKSVSFGTRTQITYAGKTSGDLQCVRPPESGDDRASVEASKELSKFVQTTLSQLKVNDRRVSSTQ